MGNPTVLFFVVVVPLLFVGVMCLLLYLISMIGGWRRLAEFFPANDPPIGQRFRMQSGSVGSVNYSSCLTIYSGPDGVYLATMWPFRLGHPPLLIPWSEIHDAKTRRILWMEDVLFEVGSPRIAKLCLPKKTFEGRGLLPEEDPNARTHS
jgi:hypothetical protein